jgi:hypothetical protein
LWVARDRDGLLLLYSETPKRRDSYWYTQEEAFYISIDLFPNLKWEDEPMEVELVKKVNK